MTESGPTKVFVGNLSFKTKDSELAAAFSQAGNVVSANIITRGNRSLGYGFVELESQAAAEKSIELLNKHVLDGREINVEIAKTREADQGQRSPVPAGADRGGERGGERGGRGRGRGQGRGRGGFGFSRGRGGGRGGYGAPRGRGGRGGRVPTEPKNRNPSSTTLFVTNLPYSLDDKELGDLFSEFNVKSSYVVRRPNNRSKGFGFVQFSTEADQKNALQKLNKFVVQGRELIVRIAYLDSEGRTTTDAAPATSTQTNDSAPPASS